MRRACVKGRLEQMSLGIQHQVVVATASAAQGKIETVDDLAGGARQPLHDILQTARDATTNKNTTAAQGQGNGHRARANQPQ